MRPAAQGLSDNEFTKTGAPTMKYGIARGIACFLATAAISVAALAAAADAAAPADTAAAAAATATTATATTTTAPFKVFNREVFTFRSSLFGVTAADRARRASTRIHADMVGCVLRAPLSFFHTNPSGRVLNRFSNDQVGRWVGVWGVQVCRVWAACRQQQGVGGRSGGRQPAGGPA